MHRLFLASITFAAVAVQSFALAGVAPGHLDPTFGENGTRTVALNLQPTQGGGNGTATLTDAQ